MDDYDLDMEEVAQVIDTADVLVVRFAILDRRLLIDSRTSELDGPFLAVVPKASSAEERFRTLKKMRPRFSLPDKIFSLLWPRQIETFRRSDLWARIEARLASLGGEEMVVRCQQACEELARLERAEVLAAIHGGEGYQSLWERSH